MLVFGPLSSVFDFATFGVMLWVFHSGPDQFRTGWFVRKRADDGRRHLRRRAAHLGEAPIA